MTKIRIAFIVVYLALLICYFFSEVGPRFSRRALNKIAMATLFYSFGTVWFLLSDREGWNYLALVGLTFSWLGDILLLWSFIKGGVSFSVGNLFLLAYEIFLLRQARVPFGRVAVFPVLFAALAVFVFLAAKKLNKRLAKLRIPLIAYMLSSTAHGVFGICLAATVPGLHPLLFGVGLALFMISDYFLMAHKFVSDRKLILRLNSGTYFVGMMLVALSFSY